MAKRENISVSFTPQQAEFLAACVASGRYQSTSEVVREGLRLLEDRLQRRQAELERARALIQEGADQLDRGQVIEGDTFFREWDEELDALEASQRRKAE
jgi:antitoxin ParD1/3/4